MIKIIIKNNIKGLISALVLAVLLTGFIPVTAFSDDEQETEIPGADVTCNSSADTEDEESGYDTMEPYVYTPMEPDAWKSDLAEKCRDIAMQHLTGYPSTAALITFAADTAGLCSVNVFKITDDTDELYRYLTQDKGMKTLKADAFGGSIPENPEGSLIFFNDDDDPDDGIFADAGIIVDSDGDTLSVVYAENGIALMRDIDKSELSCRDTVVLLEFESGEQIIWNELKSILGYYNDAALYGILSNICEESSYNSTALGDSGQSYGLCQWYRERNIELANFAVANNLSLDNITTQIRFIKYELDTNPKFSSLADTLSAVEDSKFGAYSAGYYFCLIYENPEDTVNKAEYRGNIAQSTYMYYHPDTYTDTYTHTESAVPESDVKVPDLISCGNSFYMHGDDDLTVFLPRAITTKSIKIDSAEVPEEAYEISSVNRAKITISHEYMNTLPSGWHDIYFMSDDCIVNGAVRVQAEFLSTEMAKPDIDTAVTGIIITDAPAPRGAADISSAQDYGVVMWYENTVCYISTQRQGVKVSAPEDSSYLFSSPSEDMHLVNADYIDVSNLDVSGVSDMSYMFCGAGKNTDKFSIYGLGSWDTGSVKNARYIFCDTGYGAVSWSIGSLEKWNTGSITDMTGMFLNAGHSAELWSIGEIANWDTHMCISMASMFEGAGYSSEQFILDLRRWDLSAAVSLRDMFKMSGYYSDVYSLTMSGWNLSHVEVTSGMFYNAGYSSRDWSLGDGIESWDVSNVTDMSNMFAGSGFSSPVYRFDLGAWDVGKAESMEGMFQYAGHNAKNFELLNIGKWNTSCVTDMSKMFSYSGFSTTDYSMDLRGWDVSGVTTMEGMFSNAGYNSTSLKIDLTGWNTSHVRDMEEMFCKTGYAAASFTLTGLNTWDMSAVESTRAMFSGMAFEVYDLQLNLDSWKMPENKDMTDMFRDTGAMSGIFNISMENWEVPEDADMTGCFANTGSVWKFVPPGWYRR